MKTALVCDWLTGMRGGERCLEAICELYPEDDVFTLVHIPGNVTQTIELHKIKTSYIQKLPVKSFRYFLPFFPNAIRRFDLRSYELILSFSHCVAKGVKVPKGTVHICYCHTPMRYAWHMRDEYLHQLSWIKKQLAKIVLGRLRNWDRKTSASVTHFIANSKNVQNRIKQAYDRDSVVIYPPVDCERFTVTEHNEGYYLIVSALVPYKRIDIAVNAFGALDRKLLIVGNGPEQKRLEKMAKPNVTFIETADDGQVAQYLQGCRALLFPGEEDFGIVPLEAQACGKPVIAFGKGGALETVIGLDQVKSGQSCATGIFFYEQKPEALRNAISFFEKNEDRINPQNCRINAMNFNRPIFQQSMQQYIQSVIEKTPNLIMPVKAKA